MSRRVVCDDCGGTGVTRSLGISGACPICDGAGRVQVHDSRETRIARALRVVADFAGRPFHPGVDHVDMAARFLLTAAAPLAVSTSAAFALGGVTRTSTVPGASAYDAPILAVVEALCGNLAAFEGLDRDRRVNVLRFALACLTYHTHPRLGWGPDRVQIGAAAWREVGQVAIAHQRAA